MRQSHDLVAVAVFLGALACAPAASPAEGPTVKVERLSDRVLVARAPLLGVNNVTVIATRKGLVLIDSAACPSVAGQLKQAIEQQLGRTDWAYVINTHVHEHTGGNILFKSVPIIGHENAVDDTRKMAALLASEENKASSLRFVHGKIEELQKKLDGAADAIGDGEALRAQLALLRGIESDIVKGFELVAPTMRFTDELTLDMGDLTIHALYVGGVHSASDILVHVPEEKLVVAGSCCNPFFPSIGDTVRLADLERVVPSHAEVAGRELAERRRDYYRDLLAGVADARRQGLTLEKTQAALGLEQRFPYMRDVRVFQGTREERHAANVAAVWKLVRE